MIYILAAGLFDRMRGSGWFKYSHFIGMAGMSVSLGVLLGVHGWTFLAFVSIFMLGAAPGWGNPLGAAFDFRNMGSNYEWWQIGVLRKSVPLALLARGIMWTLPTLPFSSPTFVALGALAFPLSVYMVRDIPGKRAAAWSMLEFTRGVLFGIAAYVS